MQYRRLPIAVTLLALSACSIPGGGKAQASPSPSASPSPKLALGEIVFEDALDKDNQNEWPTGDHSGYTAKFLTGYAQPGYFIKMKAINTNIRLHPSLRGVSPTRLQSYAITADNAVPGLNVSAGDEFGLTCRDLHSQYYGFTRSYALSRDKPTVTFKIFKEDATGDTVKRTELKRVTLDPANHEGTMTAVCRGGANGAPATLQLWTHQDLVANTSELVAAAVDRTAPLKEGYPGVYVGAATDNAVSMTFSNFSVTAVQ